MKASRSIFNPIVTACAVLMLSVIAVSFGMLGFGEPAIRLTLRMSARISFSLFILTFLASPLHTLARSALSRALVANRRSLGLAFALAHFTAGACIILYVSLYPESYYTVTYPLQRIGGTVGFLAIIVMVVTSFDSTKRLLPGRRWKTLHTLCLYFICINYMVSFGRRVILNHNLFYLPFFAILLAAIAVRVYAKLAPRRESQAA